VSALRLSQVDRVFALAGISDAVETVDLDAPEQTIRVPRAACA
jgi:hypothetical protein